MWILFQNNCQSIHLVWHKKSLVSESKYFHCSFRVKVLQQVRQKVTTEPFQFNKPFIIDSDPELSMYLNL